MRTYPWAKVKELIDKGLVTIPGSCQARYMLDRGILNSASGRVQAKQEMKAGIRLLENELFSHVFSPEPTKKFDVYGLPNYLSWDWYVKVTIMDFDDGQGDIVVNASFHLPERDLHNEAKTKIICMCEDKQRQRKVELGEIDGDL
jgi:hypothetical protein